jgi:signal transduction histidine kinase
MPFEITQLLQLPIVLLETVIFAMFFSKFLGKHYRSKLLYITVYAVYFAVNSLTSILTPTVAAYITVSVCFVLPLVLYSGTRMQRIIGGGLLAAYMFVSECLTMVATSFGLGYPALDIAANNAAFYIGGYASKVIQLLLTLAVAHNRRANLSNSSDRYYLTLVIIVWICAGLSYVDMLIVIQSGKSAGLLHLISEIAVAVLSVLTFYIFERLLLNSARETHSAVIEQQLVNSELRFNLIDRQIGEIREIKHDMANHLTSIRKLLNERQLEDAESYLDEYLSGTVSTLNRTITGRSSVDALLSEKIGLAEREGIVIEMRAAKLADVQINAVHLNIILSNMLDNAIEACRKLQEVSAHYIVLGLKTEYGKLYIRVSNSSLPVETLNDGLPMTDKSDKTRHGLGLHTVKRLAEQYEGSLLCSYSYGEFIAFVQMSNKSIEK